MDCLEELFLESKGQPVEYKGRTICLADRIPVNEKQRLFVHFESTNSTWRQGIHLSTNGEFALNGQVIKNAVVLWQDTAPADVELTVTAKKHEVVVKNVWDTGDGTMHSWHGGAAMIVDQSGPARQYQCNDGHCDEDFDDLIFSIRAID